MEGKFLFVDMREGPDRDSWKSRERDSSNTVIGAEGGGDVQRGREREKDKRNDPEKAVKREGGQKSKWPK